MFRYSYLYLDDGRVLFITAYTASRGFFEIVKRFGVLSENNDIKRIKKEKKWYLIKTLGTEKNTLDN